MVIHNICRKRVAEAIFARRGFSLIELLVSVSIFAFITTVVLANHSRFNSSLLLGNFAYDVALSIREAQVYGLSIRAYNNQTDIGYGIHFSGPDSYLFFADLNADQRYTAGTDSIVKQFSVGSHYDINRFCGTIASGTEYCSDGGGITYLDVVFVRPEPDAHISTNDTGATYSSAYIVVSSPGGNERTVTIASTGQISVSPGDG